MHRRITSTNTYGQCQNEVEDLYHMCFPSAGSKAVWFASALALRVEQIPEDFRQAVAYVINSIEEGQVQIFLNLLWDIWKVRNAHVIEGKSSTQLQ